MKYKIVYDRPSRIRFRCGWAAFGKNLESAVENKVKSAGSFIREVTVHQENGGILVCYKKGYREEVIKIIASINVSVLVPEAENTKAIESGFKSKLAGLTLRHFMKKWFLPLAVRRIWTIYDAAKYVWRGITTLLQGRLNVDVLDGASVGACIIQRNYNTASSVMYMLSVSALLEDFTRAKTRAALADSLAVKADKVWRINGDTDELIPMKELKLGDVIRVRSGSTIPVDGEVVSGEAAVNESSMTGEPLSVMKSKGSRVFAGTVAEEGSLAVKVMQIGSETKIQKIIELVDNSENLKAGIQSRAENLADSIVPFSFLGFGLTLLFTKNITKAVSILMVDYSCAIKLSTPISVISAIKEMADRDITVKGGKYLEEFANADSIVFDKTGTLTNAEPKLEKVITLDGYDKDKVLKISACLEEHFPHSVARAIVKAAEEKQLHHKEEHAEVEYIVAHGIASTLHGERAVIGSRHFVTEDEKVEITPEQQKIIDEESGACSVIYLAIGGILRGALCINDPPREEAHEAVQLLKKHGITNIAMLTGDSRKTAEIIAEKLDIEKCFAEVLPEDKHQYIEDLKSEGQRVIMVGDGINDAPALAAANVSVAMSDASDIARETADITLTDSDLRKLIELRILSEKLMNRINKNYRFILTFNSALLALGFFGIISPSVSAFLHNASTMGICLKSMTPLLKKDFNIKN